MKRKSILILVIAVLIIAVLSLSACGNFIIPDNNTDNTPADKNGNEFTDQEQKPNTNSKTPTLSVVGKTFKFDISAVDLNIMVYPSEDNNINGDITDNPILTIQEVQAYVDAIYTEYSNSSLTFKSNGILEQVFADGRVVQYEYKQKTNLLEQTTTVYIGETIEGVFNTELEGFADYDTLLLSMVLDEDETTFVYVQFIYEE